MHTATVWPKQIPTLSEDQLRIRDEWMKVWLDEHLSKGLMSVLIEQFNHRYPLKTARAGDRTLEIGAGLGAHAGFENLGEQEYYCNELRPELASRIQERFPRVFTTVGDCQQGLDFPDHHFDRIVAIHVLEHLPDLPRALDEVRRLLKPGGRFSVVIPAEGGLAYSLARRISSKRLFEKRYGQSYDLFIATEHVNTAREVLEELGRRFTTVDRLFYPLLVPSLDANILIGLTLQA